MLRLTAPTRLHLLITIAILVALVGTASPAFALHRPHKEVKGQIEDLEQQWRAATLAGDSAAMDRLLSDDYVGISWNGQVNTKAMQLDRTKNRSYTISQLDVSETKVKLLGNVAIVTSLAQVSGSSDSAPFNGTFRYTRVYQRGSSGGWRITNFEVTRVTDQPEHHHHIHGQSALAPPPAR